MAFITANVRLDVTISAMPSRVFSGAKEAVAVDWDTALVRLLSLSESQYIPVGGKANRPAWFRAIAFD
jgi:hypothetical protein